VTSRSLVAAALVVTLALGGCTPNPDVVPSGTGAVGPDSGDPPASGSVPSVPPGPPLAAMAGELTIWHANGVEGVEASAFAKALAGVQAANPGLTVNVVAVPPTEIDAKYAADVATGAGPDLLIDSNDDLGSRVRNRTVTILDAVASDRLGGKAAPAVAGSKVDGQLYLIPESLDVAAIAYDSVKIAAPPKTTEDLLAGVKAGSIHAGLIGGKELSSTLGWWAAFGARPLDVTTKCTADPGVVKALGYLANLQAAGARFFAGPSELARAVNDGTIDVAVGGPRDFKVFVAAVPSFRAASLPAGPAGPARPLVGVNGWSVSPRSRDLALAVAFATAMSDVGPEQLLVDEAGHVPANTANSVTDASTRVFADAAISGVVRPQSAPFDTFLGAFGAAQQAVLSKELAPTAAATRACAAMNKANGL
jgi:maltose-binding protein MalE